MYVNMGFKDTSRRDASQQREAESSRPPRVVRGGGHCNQLNHTVQLEMCALLMVAESNADLGISHKVPGGVAEIGLARVNGGKHRDRLGRCGPQTKFGCQIRAGRA